MFHLPLVPRSFAASVVVGGASSAAAKYVCPSTSSEVLLNFSPHQEVEIEIGSKW